MAGQRLQITRNQLAVICHGDAESIRQLELLFSAVTLLLAPSVSAPTATANLASGDAVLTVSLTPGQYIVSSSLMLFGSTALAIESTATLVASSIAVRLSIVGPTTEIIKQSAAAGSLYSGTDDVVVEVMGAITVTVAGEYGVRASGTGTLALGSYFSAQRVN